MSSVQELRSAFENVLSRIPHDVIDRRPLGEVIGMALPLAMNGKAPKRQMVFPLGEPPSNDDRKWRFTKADLQRAVEKFATRTEPLPVYYEHGDGPRGKIAAGWIDSIDLAADGLYANFRWTDQAKEEIEAGGWAFRSPAWDGEEDLAGFIYAGPLSHIGLVNDPAIGGMAPNVASSQPSTATKPPEKENKMANEQQAAKKTAAMDKKGILDAIKAAFPGSDVFGDDVLAGLVSDALQGAPAADPMNPGAADPATPAVPFASTAKAEDAAKVTGVTAPAKTEAELKEAKEQLAAQEARIKALEAMQLAGQIVKPSAGDRKAGPMSVPDAPSPGDHVGQSLDAYTKDRAPIHQAAIAYRDKARAAGNIISYRDAVVAVTRRKTA